MIDLDSIGLTEERRSLDMLQEGGDLQATKPEESFDSALLQNEAPAGEGGAEGDAGIDAEGDPTAQSRVPDEGDPAEVRATDEDGAGAPLEETGEEREEERLRGAEAARAAQGPRAPARGTAKDLPLDRARVKDLNAHHPLVSSLMVHGAKGSSGSSTLSALNTNQNLLDQWKSVKDPGQKTASGGAMRSAVNAAVGLGGDRVTAGNTAGNAAGNKTGNTAGNKTGNKTGDPGILELRQGALRTAGGEGGADPGVRDKGVHAAGAGEKHPLPGAAASGRSSGEAQRRDAGGDSRALQEAPKEVTPSQGKIAAPVPVEGQGGSGEATPTAGRAPNGGLEFGGLSPRSVTSTVSSSHSAQSPGAAPSGSQLADRVRLEDFSAGLERFVLKGTSKVQMRLDPPELGKVDIEIEVTDGEVFLAVRAESVEAVSALQSEMELLRESLQEQGLDLSHFELSHSDRDSADPGRDPASSNAQGDPGRSRDPADAEAASTTTRGITADGRLDVMV